MFEKQYAKSLSNPHGIFGRIVSRWLDHSLELYMDMEQYIRNLNMKNVLEIGYGTGVGIKYFAEKHKWEIDGIDRSKMMWIKAQKKNREAVRQGRICLVCGNIEEKIIQSEKYDLVFGVNILCFIEDLETVLKRIYSSLQNEGQCLFFIVGEEASRSQAISNTKYFIKRSEAEIVETFERISNLDVSIHEHEQRKGRFFISGIKRNRLTTASS